MQDSMIFYKSFADAIDVLPLECQLDAYKAIVRYAFTEEEQAVTGMAKVAYLMAKPQIDANIKRKTNGLKGGRPTKSKGSDNKKPTVKKTKTIGYENTEPNVNGNDNENDNVNDNANDNDNVNAKEKKHTYGEYKHVKLTDRELERLYNDYGEQETHDAIKHLDEYLQMNKSKKYSDHNLVLRNWVFDAVQEKKQKKQYSAQSQPQSLVDKWMNA